jgi:hypothetical protein
MLLFDCRFSMILVIVMVIMCGFVSRGGLQDSQFVFVWLVVHIVH